MNENEHNVIQGFQLTAKSHSTINKFKYNSVNLYSYAKLSTRMQKT